MDTFPDLYRYDRLYCTTLWVTNAADRVRANYGMFPKSISADGRFILYSADSASQAGLIYQLFLFDGLTGETRIISRTAEGVLGVGGSAGGLLSGDGQWAVVDSLSNLRSTGAAVPSSRSFLIRLATGEVTLLSSELSSEQVYSINISNEGRYVVLRTNLSYDVNDTNTTVDFFRYDRLTGEYALVSPCTTLCNEQMDIRSMSADGSTFLFIVYNAQNPMLSRLFTYSVISRQYTQLPITLSYLSEAYFAGSPDVIVYSNYLGNRFQVLAYKRSTNQTITLARNSSGTVANAESYRAVPSTDGNYVAFVSPASNLTTTDTESLTDVFLTSLSFAGAPTPTPSPVGTWTPTLFPSPLPTLTATPFACVTNGLVLADMRSDNSPSASGSTDTNISGNGRYVVFQTDSQLLPEDTSGSTSIYRYDRQMCTVQLFTNMNRNTLMAWYTNSVSDDGSRIVYHTNHLPDPSLYITDVSTGVYTQVLVTSDGTRINDTVGELAGHAASLPKRVRRV
jgi:hypothetical protein